MLRQPPLHRLIHTPILTELLIPLILLIHPPQFSMLLQLIHLLQTEIVVTVDLR